MSTVYGLAASDGQSFRLCTVDTNTGAWTQIGSDITLNPPSATHIPNGLMWNPTDSTMYMTAVETLGGQTNLYKLNLSNNVATFQAAIDSNTPISQGFIRGLSYDAVNERTYCIGPEDAAANLNNTYILDLVTGDLLKIGTPTVDNIVHQSTLFESFNGSLYGLGWDMDDGPNSELKMYLIDSGGSWSLLGGTALFPVDAMTAGNPVGYATTYDPISNRAYGALTISTVGVLIDTWVIDLNNGAWVQVGATGILNPQAMTVVEAICVAGSTMVETVGGQQKAISEIQEGDLVVDFKGKAARVQRNVMSGHSKQFIHIPKNTFGLHQPSEEVFIRRGHPLLVNNMKVPCEALISQFGIKEVEVEKALPIFTLVTDQETFVQMNGVPIGTWSPESYQLFSRK